MVQGSHIYGPPKPPIFGTLNRAIWRFWELLGGAPGGSSAGEEILPGPAPAGRPGGSPPARPGNPGFEPWIQRLPRIRLYRRVPSAMLRRSAISDSTERRRSSDMTPIAQLVGVGVTPTTLLGDSQLQSLMQQVASPPTIVAHALAGAIAP